MRKLGKTNILVKEIGCGGIPIQRVSQSVVNQMIDVMIEQGINFIDTARGYSNSEELLGNALKNKRNYFYLATKSMARTYYSMKKDIEISLKNLQTDYIDLYQLHNVGINDDYLGALDALQEAKLEGKIKHIGITTHSLEMLKKIVEDNIFETIQFPYNVVETQAEKIFEEANKKNIGIIVMKPLAGGAIKDCAVGLKFVLQNENISVVIPGMESTSQILQNISVIGKKITEEDFIEIKRIREILQNDFCRRCGYCMPCPQGINIPFSFLCEGYYTRYNLKEWAISRYDSMPIKPSSCIGCKICEKKCPYNIKISEKLKKVVDIMEDKNEN